MTGCGGTRSVRVCGPPTRFADRLRWHHRRVHIFHIAEASRWEAAKLSGSYAQSTLGRSLDEEGFLHAAREDQWDDVRRRYYAGVREPLVLLVIDTDRLTSPWQEDVVGDTTYPHIYGPLNPSAVVATVPLPATRAEGESAELTELAAPIEPAAPEPPTPSFAALFLSEMFSRMFAAVLVMALALALALVGQAVAGDGGRLPGLLLGLLGGGSVAVAYARRRDGRRVSAA